MEQKNDVPTPRTVTRARILIIPLLPSLRNKKGKVPAIVVPDVAISAGILFLIISYMVLFSRGIRYHNSPALITEAFTVIPLTAIKAQAAEAFTGNPEIIKKSSGTASEGGIDNRINRGRVNDSSAAAMTM